MNKKTEQSNPMTSSSSTFSLKGVYIVVVTPLDETRRLDTKSLERLVDYYVQAGVDGFTVLGEVSESDRLNDEEKDQIVRTVMERTREKRLPIAIGTSRESTQLAIEASLWAEGLGASAVMVAPPKNLKLKEEAIFDHFAAIGDALSIPIVVQDEPESNHPYMSSQLLARMSKEISCAQYAKVEEPPTPRKIERIRNLSGDKMKIFGASHGKGYVWELDRGSVGIMTASPTPEYLVEVSKAYYAGDRDRALQIFYYNLPLIHLYSEMAISSKKNILAKRGVIKTSFMKQPASELDEKERKELFELLSWVESNVQKKMELAPFPAPPT